MQSIKNNKLNSSSVIICSEFSSHTIQIGSKQMVLNYQYMEIYFLFKLPILLN